MLASEITIVQLSKTKNEHYTTWGGFLLKISHATTKTQCSQVKQKKRIDLKILYSHTMKYCFAIKRNEVVIYVAI